MMQREVSAARPDRCRHQALEVGLVDETRGHGIGESQTPRSNRDRRRAGAGFAAAADAAQTDKRLRPLARRALITALPPRVFMRTRNPWVRARRVFEGW